MAITLENEIKLRDSKIRQAGQRGLVVRYPSHIADSLGLKPGDSIEMYTNAVGEVFIRPKKAVTP